MMNVTFIFVSGGEMTQDAILKQVEVHTLVYEGQIIKQTLSNVD